ncbi:(4Fe-4S)-binding protein [Altibacter sp. HG106]|uniref:(4Fe-4S)-binding protein n=1 Tax=Altibacter sp. HG106 TaxID=3023937 RepID=UPI00234FE652|nr:(4Fe-4S)-binding protein [Altibacter sp. HG106]MDC7995679.1 (4Fe-4S)-binding protein [Altibacter sp. HG106]
MKKQPFSKEYKKEDLTVVWTPDLCIHSKVCVSKLPEVYRPDERPWIQVAHATEDALKEQIKACPSGALRYKTPESDDNNKATTNHTQIEVIENGPLVVHGGATVTLADGSSSEKPATAAFCRCGASKNKPYCDGSHTKIKFSG